MASGPRSPVRTRTIVSTGFRGATDPVLATLSNQQAQTLSRTNRRQVRCLTTLGGRGSQGTDFGPDVKDVET